MVEGSMTAAEAQRRAERDVPALPIDGLLSTADLAALCSTSPKQILNMRSRGQLPPARKLPGLGLRWSRAAVAAWLAEHTT